MEQKDKDDQGAALLPVDQSATVTTEALPNTGIPRNPNVWENARVYARLNRQCGWVMFDAESQGLRRCTRDLAHDGEHSFKVGSDPVVGGDASGAVTGVQHDQSQTSCESGARTDRTIYDLPLALRSPLQSTPAESARGEKLQAGAEMPGLSQVDRAGVALIAPSSTVEEAKQELRSQIGTHVMMNGSGPTLDRVLAAIAALIQAVQSSAQQARNTKGGSKP